MHSAKGVARSDPLQLHPWRCITTGGAMCRRLEAGTRTITIPSRSALSLQRKLVSSAAPSPITRLIRTTVISKSPVTCTRKTSSLTAMIVVPHKRKSVW
ncbi:hypothetical protein K1719_021358 [Acacia pycnantha]|nr:hypothetical protein K1719_021358 [Acacia pycnantha]